MPTLRTDIVDVYVFRRPATDAPQALQLQRASDSGYAPGTWQAVHGGIKPGETAVQAAWRELIEETGLRPRGFWQLEHVNSFYVARSDAIQMCPCFAAEVAPDAAITLNHEHDAARWIDLEAEAHLFMWPGPRAALAEIRAYILKPSAAEPLLRIPLDEHGNLLA